MGNPLATNIAILTIAIIFACLGHIVVSINQMNRKLDRIEEHLGLRDGARIGKESFSPFHPGKGATLDEL